ncbi:hypothetical protein ABIE26_001565 [Pedobacter africanus]|uniref:Uncharacterized protein n=1 Tax=Pedobacter africanus TaxID=151894 RepID=A0ACC6KRX0_9SPHI|nr:RagB/SusD family nutrient uptake outer membrane protein [Pedobacter africanus]MDR6781946.1 hypothetical protein [Pedobacter africanus]
MKNKILLAILLPLCGCQKLVDLDVPKTSLVASTAFSDQTTTTSAISGMYATLYKVSSSYAWGMSLLTGLLADELSFNGTTWEQYQNNSLIANESLVGRTWYTSYYGIYQANAIVEGVSKSNFPEAFKNQAIGEALFIRAFCHFYMVNLFGDVPLITTTNTETNRLSPRVAAADVYAQIIADLERAQSILPVTYASGTNRTRVNKYAAAALLARVYLYQKNYVAAEAKATEVITAMNGNVPLYTMVDPSVAFLIASNEAIWSFDSSDNGFPPIGTQTVPNANAVPNFTILPGLFSAFELTDKRKTTWIGVSAGQNYPNKYRTKTKLNLEFDVVLRLAEQYLIRAEARAYQNKPGFGEADVNVVRGRAGLGGLIFGSQAQSLTAIAKERRVELFAEWGHRWMDLKRTGQVDAVNGALKPAFWQSTDALLPIPTVEIANNPNLVPNPGYF